MSTTTTFKSSVSDNGYYPHLCKLAADNDAIFAKFKSNDYRYNQILEHCSYDQGRSYLEWIAKEKGNEETIEILEAAAVNDKLGGSVCYKYFIEDSLIDISPSTLRYAKVAVELEKMFGDTSNMTVCEIGGGYGGQCLVSYALYGFKKWDIVDIQEANLLQKRYLDSNFVENSKQVDISKLNELDGEYDLVVSNYAFSECKRDIQDIYMEKIIKKSKMGYMTMNFCWSDLEQGQGWCESNGFRGMMNESDIKKNISEILMLEEEPKTHPKNCIYYWNKKGGK